MRNLLIVLLIFLAYEASTAQDMEKPKALILTTGGTIASRTSAPLIEGPELVQAVPQLLDYARIEVEEFIRIGSSQMTPEVWLRLVKRIEEILKEDPELSCIVITHGTDTMEETAFFLNLTHRSKVPIVLVGSMRSSNEPSADGPANLIHAVRVGISEQAIGKGVLVVLNENISAARDLIKMDNRRADTFGPGPLGFLGVADPDTVLFYRQPLKPHTHQSTFDLEGVERLPAVDIVRDFAGFDPGIFEYFAQRPTAGLVVSTFAGGRTSQGMRQGTASHPADGKPLVIASGVKAGRIFPPDNLPPNIIYASDLTPNKARILLMLALTQTRDREEIQRIFDRY